jgi:NitT/TauT family transport system substrate-binding protein
VISSLISRGATRMATRRVRRAALAAGAAAILTAVAGCSGGGGAAAAPRVEKADLSVAVVPSLDSAGFFIVLHQGLFKAAGLNVTFHAAASSDTVIAGQVKGTYDITAGNYVSYIQAQQSGRANLDIVAEGSVMGPGAQGIYVPANLPVQTLAELKGRTLAINAPDNVLYLLAASALTEHGLSVKAVRFVTRYGFPQMPAALTSGAVSAAVLPEPFATIAQETDGALELADLSQGATAGFPVEGYVVTKAWTEKYPGTLAAFDRALEQGQEIAATDRGAVETAMEDLPSPYGVSKGTAALMTLDQYPVGPVDAVRLQRVVQAMQQFMGFTPFNIHSMLISGG